MTDTKPFNRPRVERKLNEGRIALIESLTAMPPDRLTAPATPSEHDAADTWSLLDHVVHLAGIERSFNAMIRRHLSGDANPVALARGSDGAPRTRDDIMAMVHRMNQEFVDQHRTKSLNAALTLGQSVRAETLALLSELTDAQLLEKLPGAPWADGTIGGVLAVNSLHARQHLDWAEAGLRTRTTT